MANVSDTNWSDPTEIPCDEYVARTILIAYPDVDRYIRAKNAAGEAWTPCRVVQQWFWIANGSGDVNKRGLIQQSDVGTKKMEYPVTPEQWARELGMAVPVTGGGNLPVRAVGPTTGAPSVDVVKFVAGHPLILVGAAVAGYLVYQQWQKSQRYDNPRRDKSQDDDIPDDDDSEDDNSEDDDSEEDNPEYGRDLD